MIQKWGVPEGLFTGARWYDVREWHVCVCVKFVPDVRYLPW
jgi:hypothetical protein